MQQDSKSSNLKCPGCGREYGGTPPAFCYACGTSLKGTPAGPGAPRDRRRVWFAAVAVVFVALLVAGGVTAGIVLTRKSNKPSKLPTTAAEMTASVKNCEGYLNPDGKTLAAGRARGATIYSVKARLDTVGNTLSGEETFLFTNRTSDNLQDIVLRVYANDVTSETSGSAVTISGAKAGGRQTTAALNTSLLDVKLPEVLRPGGKTMVSLSFSESIPEVQTSLSDLGSLVNGQEPAGGYGVFGHDKNIYDLGYFMPIVTTYGNGAWETRPIPAWGDIVDFDCAYYNVSLDVPDGFNVAAPGVQTGDSGSGGRRTFCFAAGPVRDFTAQASSAYRFSSRKIGSTIVTSYYLKEEGEAGRKTLGCAANALKQFDEHFGPYPYTRFNVCEAALGGAAGGMEYAGQVQIARMLYGLGGGLSGKAPESLKDLSTDNLNELLNALGGGLLADALEFTVAHEVCHQWWGLVVGSDSIAHPWQDESLTNYCSVVYFRWQHGEQAAKTQLDTEILLPFSAGSLLDGGDAAVDSPVDSFRSEDQYTVIVYSKGALFFQALEKKMGAAAFVKSLEDYYQKYAFLNATPDDLVQAFQDNASDPVAVAALHQRWIKELHASEDIAATLPGGGLLQDLLKDLPNGQGLDLGPLKDLLKQYLDDEGLDQDGSPLPSTEPSTVI